MKTYTLVDGAQYDEHEAQVLTEGYHNREDVLIVVLPRLEKRGDFDYSEIDGYTLTVIGTLHAHELAELMERES